MGGFNEDAYWDQYQTRNDRQWHDEDEEEQRRADKEAYMEYCDEQINERLLERGRR